MAILEFKMDFAGQSSVDPRLGRLVCNDLLATVTSLNYIKAAANAQGIALLPTDFIAVSYAGGVAWVNPIIDYQGNITLSTDITAGSVTVSGSVTAGHIAVFAGASRISDGGALGQAAFKLVTDNTEPSVASSDGGPSNIGFMPQFTDVKGSIGGGGVDPTSFQLVADIKANQFSFAGGSTTAFINDGSFNSGSIPSIDIISVTNPSTILSVLPGAGSVKVTFDVDPGPTLLSYIVFLGPQ